MSNFSVLTNPQAASAVLNLNKTLGMLNQTQERINTGLKVGKARDDAATFAIALGMRSDVAGYTVVRENLALGKSTLGTASAAADKIAEQLTDIKEKVTQASNNASGRSLIQESINNAIDQIKAISAAAQFNGVNLIDGNTSGDFEIVSSLNRDSDGALSLGKVNVSYEDLSVDTKSEGLGALLGVDVTAGKSTEAVTTRTDAVSADLKFSASGVNDGEQFDLNYVDADGNDQALTFTTYAAAEALDGSATTAAGDTDAAASYAIAFDTAVVDTTNANTAANGITTLSFTYNDGDDNLSFEFDAVASGATDAATLKAAIEATSFFTEHDLAVTINDTSIVVAESDTDVSLLATGISALAVEYSSTARSTLATDFAVVGGSAATAADSLQSKLTDLALDGGPLAGLGFSFDSTTVSGTLSVARGLAEGIGQIKAFTTGTTNTFTTAADTFTLNEADGKASQVELSFNKQLEAGDTIELTFNNGVNDKTFTLVVGEASDTTTNSGAEISGSNGKYHLAYSEVVDNGGVARTTDEIATAVYNVLNQAGSATGTDAGALVGDINVFLNSGTGTAATTDTLGGNSDAAFKLQLDGSTISITDTDQRASGASDAFSLSAFNMDNASGGSLDFDNMLQLVDAAEQVLKEVTGRLGASEQRVDSQMAFIEDLTKAVNDGIGTLVDANMAEESAKLQALQVQQQLGLQALSIANQAPQSILGLFR